MNCFILVLLTVLWMVPAAYVSAGEIRESRCEVTFANSSGAVDDVYKSYTQTVKTGDTVILPEVPQREGYLSEGWALKAGAKKTDYQPGKILTIAKDLKLYAVEYKSVSVSFYGINKKVYNTVTVRKGETVTLPSIKNTDKYTFLGWSLVNGTGSEPAYLPGDTLRVTKSWTFYPVLYKRSSDRLPSKRAMVMPDKGKWRKVVFVGDSRMVHTRKYLKLRLGERALKENNLVFLAERGITLEGFIDEGGEERLLRILSAGDTSQPAALIFNLGINDLRPEMNPAEKAAFTVNFLAAMAARLSCYNVRFYVMSVNPINESLCKRSAADVFTYNRLLSIGTSGLWTYIDTCSWLIRRGYTTLNMQGVDDGIHYNAATSLRIFNYVMEKVNDNNEN